MRRLYFLHYSVQVSSIINTPCLFLAFWESKSRNRVVSSQSRDTKVFFFLSASKKKVWLEGWIGRKARRKAKATDRPTDWLDLLFTTYTSLLPPWLLPFKSTCVNLRATQTSRGCFDVGRGAISFFIRRFRPSSHLKPANSHTCKHTRELERERTVEHLCS